MIKVLTAHRRITLAAFALVATGTGIGISIGDEFSRAMESVGNNATQFFDFLKAAGIISLITVLFVLAVRAGLFKMMMVPDNNSAAVSRRSKLVRNDDGSVLLHESGRNRWHVAVYRNLVLIHHGDRFTELGPRSFTVDGITWTADFTAVWLIPKDPSAIERAVTVVSDSNWWDGKFNQLEVAIKEQAIGCLPEVAKSLAIDSETGVPTLNPNDERVAAVMKACFDKYGPRFVELKMSAPFRAEGQLAKDGYLAIAKSIESSGGVMPTPPDSPNVW